MWKLRVLWLTLLSLQFLSFEALGSPKCAAVIERMQRVFDPSSVESNHLYSSYSYNAFERDSRTLVHLSSDPSHPIFKSTKPYKDEIRETVNFKAAISNRLNIEAVMKDFKLTRAQAVELQAILRRFYPKASNEVFLAVVEQVRLGKSLSGVRYENIKKAKFVVALDVDGTLLDQDYQTGAAVRGVHQHIFAYGGKAHTLAMSPGWDKLILGIKERGGSVVIFSRNSDELIQSLFESIKIGDTAVADIVDGIYSSSHMVIHPSARDLIYELPIHEVVTKDLRILGEKKTIIIDDNPEFVFQKKQNRVVSRFDARPLDPDSYIKKEERASQSFGFDSNQFLLSLLKSNKTAEAQIQKSKEVAQEIEQRIQARENELMTILEEIDRALIKSTNKGITFSEAYEIYAKKSYKILKDAEND